MSREYQPLDGYEVVATTHKALGIRRAKVQTRDLIWVPRSVVEDGDNLERGETDIRVLPWFVDREDLIT